MSELGFVKSFLSALDVRPTKLSSDHIADARQYPAQSAYTLPRLSHPPHPQRPNPPESSESSSSTIIVTLKPLKPSTPTIPISDVNPAKTSVFDLKQHYAKSTQLPPAKVKILYKKKPVADSKTVADVIGKDAGDQVEFGVMVMGGVAGHVSPPLPGTWVQTPPPFQSSEEDKGLGSGSSPEPPKKDEEAEEEKAPEPTGKEAVATPEFWGDLKSFLLQRIKDEAEGERLVDVFKGAWEQSK